MCFWKSAHVSSLLTFEIWQLKIGVSYILYTRKSFFCFRGRLEQQDSTNIRSNKKTKGQVVFINGTIIILLRIYCYTNIHLFPFLKSVALQFIVLFTILTITIFSIEFHGGNKWSQTSSMTGASDRINCNVSLNKTKQYNTKVHETSSRMSSISEQVKSVKVWNLSSTYSRLHQSGAEGRECSGGEYYTEPYM